MSRITVAGKPACLSHLFVAGVVSTLFLSVSVSVSAQDTETAYENAVGHATECIEASRSEDALEGCKGLVFVVEALEKQLLESRGCMPSSTDNPECILSGRKNLIKRFIERSHDLTEDQKAGAAPDVSAPAHPSPPPPPPPPPPVSETAAPPPPRPALPQPAPPLPAPIVQEAAAPPPTVGIAQPLPRYAVRDFIGEGAAGELSVDGVAYLAFPIAPATTEARARYIMLCEAYVSAFNSVGEMAGIPGKLFVTLWPLRDDGLAAELNGLSQPELIRDSRCADAVDGYSYALANEALVAGRASADQPSLDDRGPYLLAWAPAGQKGAQGALALILDFSRVEQQANMTSFMIRWRSDIVAEQSLWDNGWDTLHLKVAIVEILEAVGPTVGAFLDWLNPAE